jgi:hypothetical protein
MADTPDPLDPHWRELAEEALTGMARWRREHPTATLTEIEAALDERLHRLRARVLEDAALASPARRFQDQPPEQRPLCPDCQRPLTPRGTHRRHLQTEGGQELGFTREYGVCPQCGAGVFPPR